MKRLIKEAMISYNNVVRIFAEPFDSNIGSKHIFD